MSRNNFFFVLKNTLVVVWLRIMMEKVSESFMLARFSGSTNQYKDVDKKQAELQIRLHALEKGMSIGQVKIGFGKPKALILINDLSNYMEIGGCRSFTTEAISLIWKYIEFNKALGADMLVVEEELHRFTNKYHVDLQDLAGIYELNHNEVSLKSQLSFLEFSKSRYSIRDFGDASINVDKLKDVFSLCEKTPSACNRQSWRIHVYLDKGKRDKMFSLQGGCKGFDEKMQCAILVCTDQRNYGFYEQNLPFVDGGLYAMNLLYALHYNGFAAIPLTMGRKWKDIRFIKKEMNIPANEMPVLLIGVGTFKEKYKVAISHRYPFNEYIIFE